MNPHQRCATSHRGGGQSIVCSRQPRNNQQVSAQQLYVGPTLCSSQVRLGQALQCTATEGPHWLESSDILLSHSSRLLASLHQTSSESVSFPTYTWTSRYLTICQQGPVTLSYNMPKAVMNISISSLSASASRA